MKHGIYYAYWEKEWAADYCYYVDKTASLGFDVLEIGCTPLPNYSKDQIIELRNHAKKQNMILSGGYGPSPDHNIGSKDSAIQKQAFEWYSRLFDVMSQLEMHFVGGALYYYWPVDFNTVDSKTEEWQRSVEGIQKIAPIAAQYDITLGMEAINRFESYLLNTADECIKFVQDVGMPNVKVMLDTFHMNIEETSISDAIRSAGRLLGHLHTGECNRMLPGKGRIPWREIGEALRDIKYDGMVVMEPFVQMGGTVGRDIHVWRDLSKNATEEKLDHDAAAALQFQKYILE